MSGYDPQTGWVSFTPTKVHRYFMPVYGKSGVIDRRLEAEGVEWYWGASGELHAHCDDGRLWEILSGKPPSFSTATSDDPRDQPEWIKVSDLGAVKDPPMGTSTVLAQLRRLGYLERVDGKDQPTEKAQGHVMERPIDIQSSKYPVREGAVQRLWSYAILVEMRRVAAEG